MTVVYLVHGFNVADHGTDSTDRLRPYFEAAGYRVREFDYLWSGLMRVRLCNKGLAFAFAKLAAAGSIAVGHSNGCAIIHQAAQFGARFSQVVYINPALNRRAELAPQIGRAHVWHSPSDKPVKAASLLPWHIWGRMGAVGYRGPDRRYVNYNKERDYEVVSSEHSDVFERRKLAYFGPRIVRALCD